MKQPPTLVTRLWLVLALVSLMGCQQLSQSAPNQKSPTPNDEKNADLVLLHNYGWTVEGEPKESTMELPAPVDRLLGVRLKLVASKRIGLDFSDQAGKTLPLRTYNVVNDQERGHDIRAHVLIADQKIVGAWLTREGDESAPGIYALNVNPHKRK